MALSLEACRLHIFPWPALFGKIGQMEDLPPEVALAAAQDLEACPAPWAALCGRTGRLEDPAASVAWC